MWVLRFYLPEMAAAYGGFDPFVEEQLLLTHTVGLVLHGLGDLLRVGHCRSSYPKDLAIYHLEHIRRLQLLVRSQDFGPGCGSSSRSYKAL